jgi:hypothetical protein
MNPNVFASLLVRRHEVILAAGEGVNLVDLSEDKPQSRRPTSGRMAAAPGRHRRSAPGGFARIIPRLPND